MLRNIRLCFPGPHQLTERNDDDVPAPGAGQVVARTLFSLISPGTELALYNGTHVGIDNPANTFAKYPFYPGYATVGEVVSAAPDVAGIAGGDLVYNRGAHALYNVLTVNDPNGPVLRLDAGQRPELQVFARLAAISATAVAQSRPKLGETTVVIGMGLIGNLAAQLMALAGARVIGVDLAPDRLALARACGLTELVQSGPGVDLRAELAKLIGSAQVDIVVEATGVPQLVPAALDLVRPLGQVVALGSTRGRVDLDVYELIHRKGVRLSGAHERIQALPGYPNKLAITRHVLRLIDIGALKIAPLVTHRLAYTQARQGYELLQDPTTGAMGVLLDWSGKALPAAPHP